MAVQLERVAETNQYHFTVEQYEQMVKTGILHEEERIELLEGEIAPMSTIGWPHSFCVNRLISIFSPYQSQSLLIWSQSPLRFSNSEPAPDFAVIRLRPNLSPSTPPTPADVLLLVEVAESSLGRDRGRKMRLYAREGIPEYWIVNLNDSVIEVYSECVAGEYGVLRIAKPGEVLSLPSELGGAVAVDAILG